MGRVVLLLALLLPGCIDQAAVDFAFCDPGEACQQVVDACGDVEAGACPDPLLAYDPQAKDMGTVFPAASDVGDVVAARLEPFAEDTTCKSVVVVINIDGGCGKVGDELELAVFDEDGEVPKGTPVFSSSAIDIDTATEPAPGFVRLTFPLKSEHACGAYPFVAVRIRNAATCVAAHSASCDESKAFRMHGGAWESGLLPGDAAQLYVGLADCD